MENEENIPLTTEQRLEGEIAFRQQEVDGYQHNIDNYTTALQRIDTLYPQGHELHDKMQEMKSELQQRVLDEKYQQARAKLMLDACQCRLAEKQDAKV